MSSNPITDPYRNEQSRTSKSVQNEIYHKIKELEDLYKERNELLRDEYDIRRVNRIKLKPNTMEKEFLQEFVGDGISEKILVKRYHSGSFEIIRSRPRIGIPICENCSHELVTGETEKDQIFVKYTIANQVLNFLAEPVQEETLD